jgi:catechol 2,3-dioxygenase-like lactoylglutathione lyase family enzyme
MNLSFGEVQRFVSNLDTARDFYAGILGLKMVEASAEWLVFDVSGVEFIIMGGAAPGQRKETYGSECATVLCLKTENIFQDYEQLKAKGVQFFSGINEVAPGKYYVAFQDAEGNLLELIQK